MRIYEKDFIMPEEVEAVMDELDIDPLEAIAEGSLLITCSAEKAQDIIDALAEKAIKSSVVGEVTSDKSERTLTKKDGQVIDLYIPEQDPFWPAFFKALN